MYFRVSDTDRALWGMLCLLLVLLLTAFATRLVSSRASKRWASWKGAVCFALLVCAIGVTGWGAGKAWIFDHWWVPPITWLLGVLLLFCGRVRDGKDESAKRGRGILAYLLLLALLDPLLRIPPDPRFVPLYAGFLAPLVWVGVTALGRGEWLRAYGAWLVMFGQFFELVYNCAHGTSGVGFVDSWVF